MEPEPDEPATAQDQQDNNPFEEYVGVLPAFSNAAEIKAWIRDMRGDDAEDSSESGSVSSIA